MYKIELARQAAKDFEKIYRTDPALYRRFSHALQEISKNPTEGKPLQGPLRGLFSYRVGSYRILYEIHHHKLVVVVVDLGHRREIYRR